MPQSLVQTPAAHGLPLFSAELKSRPEDFRVDEILGIDPDGTGEHLFLRLRKRGLNTNELAQWLEIAYSVDSKAIGLAGMKDRHAVTSQWFSVATPQDSSLIGDHLSLSNTGEKSADILESVRHSKKIRRGAHQANSFDIHLRNVQPLGDLTRDEVTDQLASRVNKISEAGFPNYIGPQRFGFGGQNVLRARQWFKQGKKKRTSRQQRSLWLSAARSAIFNAVCAQRVEAGCWREILDGEPAMLHGSNSFFDSSTSTTSELAKRVATLDIHPSAPWMGRGQSPAKGDCAVLEEGVLADYRDLCEGLAQAGLPQERRSIRAIANDFSFEWANENTLRLRFLLSPGVFATTLLSELCLCHEPERQK